MLAKVPPRPSGRGTFAALRTYIAEASRASSVELSRNLLSLDTAAAEMASVAAQAPRCRDPVYHFVLSWQAGEIPSKDQAVEAGRYALATLGMLEHQHIVAVHTNTAHVHAHVAVNRVSPTTYRAVGHGYDYFKLDAACRSIENAQGWSNERGPFRVELDEAGGRRMIGPDRIFTDPATVDRVVVREVAQWRGEQQFPAWVRGEPAHAVNELLLHGSRPGWEDVHRTLGRFNLVYARRQHADGGVGGMILDRDDPTRLRMKASAAGDGLALPALESRLGRAYAQPSPDDEPAERAYRDEMAPRAGTDELRARFLGDFLKSTSPDRGRERNAAWRAQRESERAREKQRRSLAAQTKLHDEIVAERASLRRKYAAPPMPTWRGWLQREAAGGDLEALAALASLNSAHRGEEFDAPLAMSPGPPVPPKRATIAGARYVSHRLGIDYLDATTDELLVRDTGVAVYFANRSATGIRVGMELCNQKWGENGIVVTGDRAFQRSARTIGGQLHVNILEASNVADANIDRGNLKVAERAYVAHRDDILGLAAGVIIDDSRIDRMVAQRMRATGFEEPMVRAIMAGTAMARERGEQYAQRQTAYAFAPVELTGAAINEADFDRFRGVWSAVESAALSQDTIVEIPRMEPRVFRRPDVDLLALASLVGKPIVQRDPDADRRITGVLVDAGREGDRFVAVLDAGRTLEVLDVDGEMARELRDRKGEQFVAAVLDGLGETTIIPRWSLADIHRPDREREELDVASTLGRVTE